MGIISMLLGDDDQEKVNDKSSKETANDTIDEQKSYKTQPQKLDYSKVIQMSLIHDIAECIVGDITPFDGIAEDEKHQREFSAMKYLGKHFNVHKFKILFYIFEFSFFTAI